MSNFCSIVLVLSLLMLSVTRGSTGKDQDSLDHQDAAVVAAIKGFRKTLKYFGDAIQVNNDALMFQVKEQINQIKDDVSSVKKENAELHRVNKLTQTVMDMESLLRKKDKIVDTLTRELKGVKLQLDNKSLTVDVLTQDVTSLKSQLANKEKMEEVLKRAACMAPERVPHNTKAIKELVQTFSSKKEWQDLKSGLEAVLDHSSEVYGQLNAGSLWRAGERGYIQLASLLLCFGMPVDTADSKDGPMLDGAAHGGQLQLVKLLLDHKADVNVRSAILHYTPILSAAYWGHFEIVKLLVQAGADITARNNAGQTALSFARLEGHTQIAQYLEQIEQ